jgi:hypothetical protein
MTNQPKTQSEKKRFGGKQEGAGRKELPPEQRQHPLTIFVDYDTLRFLQNLSRTDAVALKREAASVLSKAEIDSRIL